MHYIPLPTTHPSIPSGVWTKVTVVAPEKRKYLLVVNEDQAIIIRYETVARDAAEPTLATEGLPLGYGFNGFGGGSDQQDFDKLALGHLYIYQASGGAITTVGVKEGY